jgi:hypothetical protein
MDRFKIQAGDTIVEQMLRDYRFVHERKVEYIENKTMTFDLFDIGPYRTIITQGDDISFATCNCKGFHILTKCKHIHYALNKMGDSTPHGIAQHKQETNK